MRERRSFVRTRIDTAIDYYNGNNERIKTSVLQDISGGGLRFLSYDEVEKGKTFHVAFTLPGTEHQVLATIEIVWASPKKDAQGVFEMGANFAEISNTDREKIADFIFERKMLGAAGRSKIFDIPPAILTRPGELAAEIQ